MFQSALTLINKPGYPLTHGSVRSLLCEWKTVPENGYKTTHNNFIHAIDQVQNRLVGTTQYHRSTGGEDCRAITSAINSAPRFFAHLQRMLILLDDDALFSLLFVLQIVLV